VADKTQAHISYTPMRSSEQPRLQQTDIDEITKDDRWALSITKIAMFLNLRINLEKYEHPHMIENLNSNKQVPP